MLKKNLTMLVVAIALLVASAAMAGEVRNAVSGNFYQPSKDSAFYQAVSNVELNFFLKGELIATATTDEFGHFAVDNLRQGNYLLVAESLDGENYGATSLYVKYDETGELVFNFKLTKVGLQRLPADFDPNSLESIKRAQDAATVIPEVSTDAATVNGEDGTYVQDEEDRRRALLAYPGTNYSYGYTGGYVSGGLGYGSVGGFGSWGGILGIAGLVAGVVAIADNGDGGNNPPPRPVSPSNPFDGR